MAADRDQIARWYDKGIELGATHMVVVTDTYANPMEDYPQYVMPGIDARAFVAEIEKNGQAKFEKVMEVYNLAGDKEEQLDPKKYVRNF